MTNRILLTFCAVLCLVSVTKALRFKNAVSFTHTIVSHCKYIQNFYIHLQYIQNVKSGRCVTIKKDENFSPLFASKCNCNPLQLWKNQDGEHVINELATHAYMDELWGAPDNGKIIGNFDLTGSNWQKWKIQEDTVCVPLSSRPIS